MNCNKTQSALDNYLDGELSAKAKQDVESHIAQCADCQQYFDDAKATNHMLSSLPYEPPSDDFEAKVFKHVRQHYATKQVAEKGGKNFMAGFATAIAAGVVIWFANVIFISSNNTSPSNIIVENAITGNTVKQQFISVAMNEVQTIRLMLDSDNDVKDVTLSLGLPDNIRLKGYESRKKLIWKTTLSKGDNILTLPVKAIANGQGHLIAQVQYGNTTKQFRILVKTLSDIIKGDVFIKQIGLSKSV